MANNGVLIVREDTAIKGDIRNCRQIERVAQGCGERGQGHHDGGGEAVTPGEIGAADRPGDGFRMTTGILALCLAPELQQVDLGRPVGEAFAEARPPKAALRLAA